MSKLHDTRLEVYCILPCLVIIQAGFYARFLGRKWEIYSNFDEVVTCSTFHLGKQPPCVVYAGSIEDKLGLSCAKLN